MRRIGANSSLIMPMVAPRMANLIIFVKNDESEAGNTVPTSVAPWRGRCSPLVCTRDADHTHGAPTQRLTSWCRGREVCLRGDMADISIFEADRGIGARPYPDPTIRNCHPQQNDN